MYICTTSEVSMCDGGLLGWFFLRKYTRMKRLLRTASVLLWAALASCGVENCTKALSGSPS